MSEFPRLNYGYESRAKLASFDPLTTSVVTFLNASVIFLPLLLGQMALVNEIIVLLQQRTQSMRSRRMGAKGSPEKYAP